MKRFAVLFVFMTSMTLSAAAEDCQQTVSRIWNDIRARDMKMRQEKEAAQKRAQTYVEQFVQILQARPEFHAYLAQVETASQTAKAEAKQTYRSTTIKVDPTIKRHLGSGLPELFKTFLSQAAGEKPLKCTPNTYPRAESVTCDTASQISFTLTVTAPNFDYLSQFGVYIRTAAILPFYTSLQNGPLEATINGEGYVELSGMPRRQERDTENQYLLLRPAQTSAESIDDRVYSIINTSDDLLSVGRRLILQQLPPQCHTVNDRQALGTWSPLLPILRLQTAIPAEQIFPAPLLDLDYKFRSYPRYQVREATLYFQHGQFVGTLSADHTENEKNLNEKQIKTVRELERGHDSYCWIRATFPEKLLPEISFPKKLILNSEALDFTYERADKSVVVSAILLNTADSPDTRITPHILRLGCKVISKTAQTQDPVEILVGTLREALGRQNTSLQFINGTNTIDGTDNDEGDLP